MIKPCFAIFNLYICLGSSILFLCTLNRQGPSPLAFAFLVRRPSSPRHVAVVKAGGTSIGSTSPTSFSGQNMIITTKTTSRTRNNNNDTSNRDISMAMNSSLDSSTILHKSMEGCVCVVTGASRGIGKGIALELGRAGATVYVTGTSSSTMISKHEKDSMYVTNEVVGGPETIEQTAEEINQVGGIGIPIYCDHSQDDQVKTLFETIQETHGRLDLLVNNVFRIPPGGTNGLFGKFWEVGIQAWDSIHTVGCRSHYVASCYAVPLMKKNIPRAQGSMTRPMIAMISSFGGITYTFNVAYGVGKAAVDRLAKDMAVELKDEDIVVTSFYPGVVLTERTQRAVNSGEWEKNVGIPLDNAETPNYTGKAIISVATDAANMCKTGTVQVVAELAQEYGFTEDDGRQPSSIRSLKFLLPAYGFDEATREKVKVEWIPDWKIPFFVMAQGKPPDKSSSSSSSPNV
jgi:NAD(P)-dependent dehydrogenase (short-subunit alcohol dehydrogenase family)